VPKLNFRRNALGVKNKIFQANKANSVKIEDNILNRYDTYGLSTEVIPEETLKEKLPSCYEKFQVFTRAVLEHPITNFGFIILTIWALFADDIKMMTTTVGADVGYSISIIIIQVIFSIEVVVGSLCVPGYFLGFFFWLDVLSIVSLLLNINWVNDIIIENISGATDQSFTGKKSNSKTVKVGTKAVTVLRIVRLIRIVRVTKIFKISEKFSSTKNRNEILIAKDEEQLVEKLNIGKKLSDSTMRRVIFLIMSMIMGIIILDPNFYFQAVTSNEFSFKMLNDFKSINDPGLLLTIDELITTHMNTTTPVIFLRVLNLTFYGNADDANDLRDSEKIELEQDCSNLIENKSQEFDINEDNNRCYVIFENKTISQLNALISMMKTIAVCMILIFGAFCFSKDTNSMVLMPLDNMVRKIQRISKNPAKAKQENEIEEYFELLKHVEERSKVGCCTSDLGDSNKNIETIILDKTIMKIGSLVAMGFGEAGSQIMEKNLLDNAGEVNPMSPGEKIIGLFAHLDIFKSHKVSKAMNTDYAVLLNDVLNVVSDITAEFNIYNMKSTGDGMLLIWKINDDLGSIDSRGNITVVDCPELRQIVDMTIICLLKIQTAIQTSKILSKVRIYFNDNFFSIEKIILSLKPFLTII
jgi:hypothetical protein